MKSAAHRSTHVLLLRHGETDANAGGVLQGHQQTPLNRTGVRQAVLLAQRLKAFRPPIEVLISSDLARAMQTAGTIAAACGLKVLHDSAWRERKFGLLEGKPVGDRELWRAASGEIDPPGAEPTSQMHQRVLEVLLQLPKRHPRAHAIAIVTHGGPIRSVLRMLTDGSLRPTRGQALPHVPVIHNCSILHLVARPYRDGLRWKVSCVNDSSHLQEIALGQ